MTTKEIENVNLLRSAATIQQLNDFRAIPVLTLGVVVETEQLITVGYTQKDKWEIRTMLQDYIDMIDIGQSFTLK